MKLPLVTTLKNRGSTTAKDGRMLNAYAESRNGVMRAVKRPSTVATFAALEGGAGSGQGLFGFSIPGTNGGDPTQTLVGIQNDILNNSPTSVVARLAFTTQPVDWKIATAMSPSVVLTAQDSFGNTMTGYTGTVTISFAANPNDGTLSGTLSVAAIAGVATFSNLKIDKVGGGYKLRATAPLLRPATSSVFKIISNLSFTVQPSTAAPGAIISTVEVSVVDSSSAVITGYVGNITVAIGANGGSPAGTLSGTLTVTAVNGVASFSSLEIDEEGDGYTLVASETSGGMADKTSSSFNIVNFTHVLTSVTLGGIKYGMEFSSGSIAPTTLSGATIEQLWTDNDGDVLTTFSLVGSGKPQDFFTSITCNGVTLLTADADIFGNASIRTFWTWDVAPMITGSGTSNVTIV